MTVRPLVVVGDVLLDVDIDGTTQRLCPDSHAPVVDVDTRRSRPGGAGLAALLAARGGVDVRLVAGLGNDAAATQIAGMLGPVGLVRMRLDGTTPSKTRVRTNAQSVCRLDTGDGRVPDEPLDEHVLDVLRSAGAVLVADYGRGVTHNTWLRRALAALPAGIPLVWDPHPNGAEPAARADLVVPNRSEASRFAGIDDPITAAVALRHRWGCGAVAVTLGAEGAALVPPEAGKQFAAARRSGEALDSCGAGDSFAATAARTLFAGATTTEAVASAVDEASRFVSVGGASAWTVDDRVPARHDRLDAFELAAYVRRHGGRLVAAGGCFDLLHPGHVRLLEQARALGDALVVCINSDASLRRLKGPARPVLSADDRAQVLRALQPVDAVAVFDEDSPCALLDVLRPDVWVKGDDYRIHELPETGVVRRHGGEIVLIPIADGHSTTRLLNSVKEGDV